MLSVSKRQKPLVMLLCVAVIVGLIFAFHRDPEPRYRDIPLSQWLALERSYHFRELSFVVANDAFRAVPGRDTLGPEAAEAVRQIGTNALPSLIAWMNIRQQSWKVKLAGAVKKLPPFIRPRELPGWCDYSRDMERASLAYTGFRMLGPTAAPAIPDLARIARDRRALLPDSAVSVLVQIRKPAVPALTELLSTNVAKVTRRNAMQGLGFLGPTGAESVPTIASCLSESDEEMACLAARTLGRIKRRSEVAIPALVEGLDDSRFAVRLAVVRALGDYGLDASPAIASLRDLCIQPDIQLGQEAARALLMIDSASSGERVRTDFNPISESLGFR